MTKHTVKVWEDRTEWLNEDCELHRLDGPAVEYADGSKQWWLDGRKHRLDGPASEWADGSKYWYVHGKLHRLDGPAIELSNGFNYWYIDDEELSEYEFNDRIKQLTCEDNLIEIDGVKYKLTKV